MNLKLFIIIAKNKLTRYNYLINEKNTHLTETSENRQTKH